jgi:hypothetical protein
LWLPAHSNLIDKKEKTLCNWGNLSRRSLMARMTSCCGLDCSACNAYLATKNNDAALIEQTAREWSKMYHSTISPENVWCDGCASQGGRHCGHCFECEIRACAQAHNAANCGLCPEYGCATISSFIELVPDVKPVLDKINNCAKSKARLISQAGEASD